MLPRLAPLISLASLAVIGSGCETSTEPDARALADHFERLAAAAWSEDSNQARHEILKGVAAILRRGAPLGSIAVEGEGRAARFNAVTLQLGIGDASGAPTSPPVTYVAAWQGNSADRVIIAWTIPETLTFPQPQLPGEDSVIFVSNPQSGVTMLDGRRDVWASAQGSGAMRPVETGGTCPAGADTSYVCTRVTMALSFDVTVRPHGATPGPVTRRLVVRDQRLRGVRFVKKCPRSCSISIYE